MAFRVMPIRAQLRAVLVQCRLVKCQADAFANCSASAECHAGADAGLLVYMKCVHGSKVTAPRALQPLAQTSTCTDPGSGRGRRSGFVSSLVSHIRIMLCSTYWPPVRTI